MSEKIRWYIDKAPTISLTARNKGILTLLNLYGASTSWELSRYTGLNVSTVEVELRYMEKLGIVKVI